MKTLFSIFTLTSILIAAPIYEHKIPFQTPEEIKALQKDFIKTNPQFDIKTPNIHFSHSSGLILSAFADTPTTPPAREDKIAIAKDFMAQNKKFFGLAEKMLNHLKYKLENETTGKVVITKDGPTKYLENGQFPAFEYNIQIDLRVSHGKVLSIINRTNKLPLSVHYLSFNDKPKVKSEADTIMNQMIGREMFFNDFEGKKTSAGKINKSDIYPAKMVLYQTTKVEPKKEMTALVVCWKYKVILKDMYSWEFYFSIENGQLVEVKQVFFT
jgi:hypothetical protein